MFSPGRSSRVPALLLSLTLTSLFSASTHAASLVAIHSFHSVNTDGANPYATLVQASDGNFYGTTYAGGAYDNGTVFRLSPDGSVAILHAFTPTSTSYYNNFDGTNPKGALVQGSDGNFYGTTWTGGLNGNGTVFQITPPGTLTTITTFGPGFGSANGSDPQAGVIQAGDGNFYGTNYFGGANGNVFKVTPAGALTVFRAPGTLSSSLVQGSDGNFYGVTVDGGGDYVGSIFKMTPDGTVTSIHSFVGTDGGGPEGALVQGADGALYGTARDGGLGFGTVFKVTSNGAFTVLHNFSGFPNDGATPMAGLVLGSDGNFYGTTYYGGVNGNGTVYRITPTGVETALHSFHETDYPGGTNSDGANPRAPLIQAWDGLFYGTTENGGSAGYGTAFRFSTAAFDFNVDGHSDIVFQNKKDGSLALWFMNGATLAGTESSFTSQNPNWQAVGVGDFNGDGQPNILFQNATTGQMAVWYLNGYETTGAFITPTQDPNWKVVSVADFNGDGQSDILFQNANTGQMAVWYMNGTMATGAAYITPSQKPGWQAVGTGDFNGDGAPDIVFQNTSTGQLAIWFMNGTHASGATYISAAQSPNWQAVAIADYNGDGHPDIVFQNPTTGQLAVWFMNGASVLNARYITPSQDPNWRAAGPR